MQAITLDAPSVRVALDVALAVVSAIGLDLFTKRRVFNWMRQNFGNPLPPKPYEPPTKLSKRQERKIAERTAKEQEKMAMFYDPANLKYNSNHITSGCYATGVMAVSGYFCVTGRM